MLFNFEKFIHDLEENPEKREVVEKYRNHYPDDLSKGLKEQRWYREYVRLFKPVSFAVPQEIQSDFDWDLLMQLVAASFSSDGMLVARSESDLPDFCITAQSGTTIVVKSVTELWGFQVLRLYEIFVEELMNLEILIAADKKEEEAILAQRQHRLARWNYRTAILYESELELSGLLQAA